MKIQTSRWDTQRGFSILQMIVTLAIISIVGAFALMNVRQARASVALQNSARTLASYLERARFDAVRRHGTTSVVFNSRSTYQINMDFDGAGYPTTRTFSFESGVAIDEASPLPPPINFNWRGRTSACTNTFAFFNANKEQSWVDVSDAGDVTVNSTVDVLPAASYNPVSATSDIASSTVVSGTTTHNNTVDCTDTDTPPPGPPISGGGSPGCPTFTVSPSSLSIRKNGGSSAVITVNMGSTATVSATAPANLQVSPASQTIIGGSSATFTVTSINKTRGTFAVTVTLPCASPQTVVKVTN